MEILFEKVFERDIKKVQNPNILQKIKEIILQVKQADKISEIRNLLKIRGHENFYRLRIGNYRIGLEITSGKVVFVRFLNRKEIYRYFPS